MAAAGVMRQRPLRSAGGSRASGVPSKRQAQVGDGQQRTQDRQKDRNHNGDPGSHREPTSHSGKERGNDAERPQCEEADFEAVYSHHP